MQLLCEPLALPGKYLGLFSVPALCAAFKWGHICCYRWTDAGSNPWTSEEPKSEKFETGNFGTLAHKMKYTSTCVNVLCAGLPTAWYLTSRVWPLKSGLVGCLVWRNPVWMVWKKPPNISPLLPEPCQGCVQKTGWSLGRPRQQTSGQS